jgi:glycosyltransferase involved in cell wall biosynthesis
MELRHQTTPPADAGGLAWPAISLVTPSFNAGRFLGASMASVLDQRYPNLQYAVIDGGSTDGSVEIIKSRADELHYWISERDEGPYDAIAKGFAKTDAEIMGWIGADDLHLPWALRTVGAIFRDCPQVDWVTTETPMEVAADGSPLHTWHIPGFNKRGFRGRENMRGHDAAPGSCIQQESTFWRRSLWERAGAKFAKLFTLAGDFELWDRFFDHALLYSVNLPLGVFRLHGATQKSIGSAEKYNRQCRAVLARHGNTELQMEMIIERRARMAGLYLEQYARFHEPCYQVRRNPETGRFSARKDTDAPIHSWKPSTP